MENYLKQIVVSSDNDEIVKFLSDYKEDINSYIKSKWDEYKQHKLGTEAMVENVVEEKSMTEIKNEPIIEESSVSEESIIETKQIEVAKLENENQDVEDLGLPIVEPGPEIALEKPDNSEKKGADNYQKEKAKNDVFDAQLRNKHISFPNGKVNQDYLFSFDIEDIIPEIGDVSFKGLSEIGLEYFNETKEIKGIPNKHGDLKVKMICKRKDWEEGKPSFERDITIIVNPDPKSLWNNIATSEEIEYYKPDCDKKFVKVESKKSKTGILGLKEKIEPRKDMVAASQRGRSHAHEGKPRDDDFALHFDELNEWYIMTVADGAGSAKYSRRGSQIACKTVIDVCTDLINSNVDSLEKTIKTFNEDKSQENRNEVGKILYNIIGTAAFKSYKNIEKEAQEKEYLLKDYSTTLIVSICKKFSFGWFVGAFWVGDGGIGIYNKETQYLKVLGESDGGEFAGQTRFLTMSEIIQNTEIYRRLRFDVVDDFTALILMTDGITDPKFETDANLLKIEKWDELWNDLSKEVDFSDDNVASADQLLTWLDFWSPGNHDDRTIAILF